MFVPPITRAQAKTSASFTNSPARQRSTPAAHRFGHGPAEQALMLQRAIGNQGMLRLLASQRATNLTESRNTPLYPPDRPRGSEPRPQFPAPLPGVIQRKLAIGQTDDPLEHEADRIADQVMRMPAPKVAATSAPPQISRKCTECGEEENLQKKEAGSTEAKVSEAPASVHQALRSPGQPLDAATRAYFEPRFGQDFSTVRVHSDSAARQSARAINANAYTVRQNIVFGAGQFAPHQSFGRTLLAHELAHVVQQGRPEAPAASQGNCERGAEDAAGSIGSGNAPVVRTSAVSGTVQRQAAAEPIARQASQKKSRLVRIERYWHSPSARAFFEDGSNEEVTFVEASSLDPAAQPEGVYEKVVDLTIDRSSPIRPHVEFASHSSGSKVKVVTRLSPGDRISKLPANVREELSQGFLSDPENESNPQTMEFAADMGDRLKETSSTTKIEMEGRDPATLARMQAVDQWVGEQQSNLDKLDTTRRARFTQLLSDVRRVGVTGPAEAEDLSAQDIELVLAGAAGGQSDFRTFDEFKQGMDGRLRSGNISLPAETANNPDFFIRNEYRKAWKAEAAGLRRMSRIAAAAQVAPFAALGLSAAVGTGGAGLEAFGAWASVPTLLEGSTGISYATWLSQFAKFGLGVSFGRNLIDRSKEGIAAGSNPLAVLAAALEDTVGGKVVEKLRNKSNLTGKELDLSTGDRVTGGFLDILDGLTNVLGASESAKIGGETPPPVTTEPPVAGTAPHVETPPPVTTEPPVAGTAPHVEPTSPVAAEPAAPVPAAEAPPVVKPDPRLAQAEERLATTQGKAEAARGRLQAVSEKAAEAERAAAQADAELAAARQETKVARAERARAKKAYDRAKPGSRAAPRAEYTAAKNAAEKAESKVASAAKRAESAKTARGEAAGAVRRQEATVGRVEQAVTTAEEERLIEAEADRIRKLPQNVEGLRPRWDYERFPNGPRRAWMPGDSINMPDAKGIYPVWSTIRKRIWRTLATDELAERAAGRRVRATIPPRSKGPVDPNAFEEVPESGLQWLDPIREATDKELAAVSASGSMPSRLGAEIEHARIPQRAGDMLEAVGVDPNTARRVTKVGDPDNLMPTRKEIHAIVDKPAHEIQPSRNPTLPVSLDVRATAPFREATNEEIADIIEAIKNRRVAVPETEAQKQALEKLRGFLADEKKLRPSSTWEVP
jgi:Domain of unknown function (DUF4157)